MRKIVNEQVAVSVSNPLRARFYDYPCFTYPWHFHSEYELIYVERGWGRCLVGDSVIDYRAGDLILFGSGLPHCMLSAPEALRPGTYRVSGVNIQFEKDFMQHAFGHYVQFASIRNLLEMACRGICFSLESIPGIVDCVKSIPQAKGAEQLIQLLVLLQQLAVCPQKRLAASPHYNPSSFNDKKMERILSYLNKCYTRHIPLAEIASYTAMNEAAFCRYFKEHTGKTFTQYVLDMRIGYACRLLADSGMNVSQISVACGFETLTNFNRVFKRITGTTPTDYRETVTA